MTIQDINDVTAGEYELVAVQWDEITSKLGEPFDFIRHRRGDTVTLDVSEAKRLWLAGAVVEPGARERAQAEAARQAYEVALANLPTEVREQVLATQAGVLLDGQPESQSGEPSPPPARANKAAWVDYAVAVGFDRAYADSLKLPDLKAALADDNDESETDQSDQSGSGENDDSTEGTPDGASSITEPPLAELPIKAADEDEWRKAAVARGYSEDDAAAYSKQELIELLS